MWWSRGGRSLLAGEWALLRRGGQKLWPDGVSANASLMKLRREGDEE